MELETISGLPAHPLIVHAAVVLIPLAALATLLFVLLPSRRDAWRFPVGLLTLGAAAMTVLAAGSGEAFEEIAENRPGASETAIEHHAELGELARNLTLVFAAIVVVYLFLEWRNRRPQATAVASSGRPWLLVLGIAAILAGGAATYADVQAGHSGAESVWGSVTNSGGEDDEAEDEDDD